ncbi:ABC transporter ATP-binding protein [Variovorax sp. CY25R-8]|uniref:ABC transporter ATP-binding protein n=1 Tax=Variovorax sp. CY25R-8 TaxID=2855501 RepID=UPI0021BB5B00|nr:ABC transporter ATP-binding protein [Variovorax sp. CY25R-8]MCT8179219.1 ABC transporter ATP-binding protein [Variovorax sp. CY25R-8]
MTDSALPILRLSNIWQKFGGLVANAEVTLDVKRGEILGLIGPNGAGKSTLFNLIAGATSPVEGRIVFDGQDVTRLDAPRRCALGIGRTFQVPRSFDSMSVLDNVVVGAFTRHARARAARAAALDALAFTGLEHRAAVSAGELTPPERRRLEVARALVTEPRLLLLDEVMTGLTPSEARLGVELIRRIRDRGITVIMVEHVMEIVMPLVDRAVVLNLGRILSQGTPGEVVRDPAVIAAYLGDSHRAA